MDILMVSLDSDSASPESRDRLLSLTGERGRERFAVGRKSGTALQSLVAEVAARWLLARALGCPFDDTQIERNLSGKPRFSSSGVSLSISHTEGMVAVAIADRSVGIDVQRVRGVRPELADRFFLPREIARIHASDLAIRNQLLIEMWTRKESFAKFDERGLRQTIGRFGIGEGSGPVLPVVDVRGAPIGVATMLHSTIPGFALASCAVSGTTHPFPCSMTTSMLLAKALRLRAIRSN